MKRVRSKPVEALRFLPNCTPSFSKVGTSVPAGKWSEPLKARCSKKCASPRWSSSSLSEPDFSRSRMATQPGGVWCSLIA